MKFTYNWLKDFVDLKDPAVSLAHKLTMAGLEVVSLEERGGDFVFEAEVTPNRPDCLSIIGIAKEAAAVTNSKLKIPDHKLKVSKPKAKYFLKIEIQDKRDCPLYTAKIIKGIKVAPSPDWMRKRLELVGCRLVNNVVDITNYILLEWGEPLHAFDLDKLNQDAIIVRRAKNNEKIVVINGEEKNLSPDTLVIADRHRPLAVAGVMGGEDSEVTESTKDILLEAAVFNPITVRRSRQRLGLQSESSFRFERGVDSEVVQQTSYRAVRLIQDICGGEFVLAKASGSVKTPERKATLDLTTVNKVLGINLAESKIKAILNKLEFKAKKEAKNKLLVQLPSHRPDVKSEIDLIEEIARIFGYERIPTTLPKVSPQIICSQTQDKTSLIKSVLVGLGLDEVITYSLIDQDSLKAAGFDCADAVWISNPLSKEQEVLRPTIIPSLLRCVALNLNQQLSFINIFEVAKVFWGSTQPREEPVLGVALCGVKSCLLQQGLVKEQVGPLYIRGILETIFERLGIKDYRFEPQDACRISVYINKEKIGTLVNFKEGMLDKFGIEKKEVFVAEVFLNKLFPFVELKKRFQELPKYPAIVRDISIVIQEEVLAETLLAAIQQQGKPLLRKAEIVDYYKGKQIPTGYKGLTVSCLYRSDERTLTEAEVNSIHQQVVSLLADRFKAQIR